MAIKEEILEIEQFIKGLHEKVNPDVELIKVTEQPPYIEFNYPYTEPIIYSGKEATAHIEGARLMAGQELPLTTALLWIHKGKMKPFK